MTDEQQLKLQAFLDGELPEAEAAQVASWLARDREAADLHRELRQTRQALKGFETEVRLPESREFYWSKIERAILSEAAAPRPAASAGWLTGLRRLLVPVSAVAVMGVLLAVAVGQWRGYGFAAGPDTETALDDSGTFTYQDYAHGTTLVWVSYAGQSEFAEDGSH
ncbi:MAG: hypothetical protein U1F98_17540 [Verrucomicrobiota bacterium]